MARGRRPSGPKLVKGLTGSRHAKTRLEVILRTVTGEFGIAGAAEELGVCQSAFYKLRTQAFEGALSSLEPKPAGRPPKLATEDARCIAELESEINRLKTMVAASHVREELALAMPFLAERRKSSEKLDKDLERLRKTKGGRGSGRKACAGGADDGRSESRSAGAGRDGAAGGPDQPQRAQAR